MNECDLIRSMTALFPRSPLQRNEPFSSDAELIEINGRLWALTIDEFSPEEDLFSSDDPERLGANLATATLSDLLAAGAAPTFFMDAVSVAKDADAAFVSGLAEGIRSVLNQANCALCGGDVGTAETWRFCGFAMGPIVENRPLTHIVPEEPHTLWVTGRLGDANLAAFEGNPTPRFELRLEEARVIRRHGAACIDTSGGFMDAVWLLHTQNPLMRFAIDLEKLPLAQGLDGLAKRSRIPQWAALLGGAGEYELLFAAPATLPESITTELSSIGAACVGAIAPHAEPGVYVRRNGETVGVMSAPPPCPRDAATIDDHIEDVLRMAKRLFG